MNLIVAVDKNWAIGYKNKLLVRIPADQRFFRNETINKAVIMGRKTLESFPGGLPLKDRLNVVLTSDPNYKVKDAVVVNSIEKALEAVKEYNTEDVYVIGGESIYRQMLPLCDVAHVTKIDYAYQADAYFPNLDEMEDWVITGESDEQTYYDIAYTFYKYERKILQ
ncbi:dihydrofolate reductase [Herbinix luporum]|uniref:dihydrofolate reductase n=1 Tax=Herbinix luporum TaxID=1679721 RepID=UPI001754152B|nr:dihydrofolate reductase [Herbinix luporum]HHT56471.1 dihydrofolate reductase [Herbinix luporum]